MSPKTHDELHAELTSLFLKASEAAALRIHAQGWPYTVNVTEQHIAREPDSPDSWRSEPHEVQQNILGPHPAIPTFTLAPLLTPDVIDLVKQCAAHLIDLTESNLPYWSAFAGRGWPLVRGLAESHPQYREYAEAPGEWTLYHLLLPALDHHLSSVQSVDSASADDAGLFAKEVLDVATAPDLSYRVTIPLAGIDIGQAEGTVIVDNMTVRRLSSSEQGTSLEQEWRPGISFSIPAPPLISLEITVSTERQAQNPDVTEIVRRWLCALQLHGYEITGRYAQFEANPSWRMLGTSYTPITLPTRTTDWSILGRDNLTDVRDTVNKLDKYNLMEPSSTRDLALHRFRAGAARGDVADAVLDFVISLEALLLPYDENARHGDLGYRFRTHGAHYLSVGPEERRVVAKKLSNLYALRSRLVHGNKYPTHEELALARKDAGELTRKGLRRALDEGFPTVEMFRDMVLGV